MKYLWLILLFPTLALADSVSVGTPTLIGVYTPAWGIGYPRHHIAIDFSDSQEMWINGNRTAVYHTTNEGSSWTQQSMSGSGLDHACIAINGADSVMLIGCDPNQARIMNGNTLRTQYGLPTNWAIAVAIGDPNNDRFFTFGRQGSPYTVNFSYAYTTNSGQNWTDAYIINEGVDGRVSSAWLPGKTPVTSVYNYTDNFWHWYYISGTSIDSTSDKVIASGAEVISDNRTFMFDIMETSNDTLMFGIQGISDSLIVFWKSYDGGTGSWTRKKIAVDSDHSVGTDWKPTCGVIDYEGTNAIMFLSWIEEYSGGSYQKIYGAWWDTSVDSIGAVQQLSRDADTTITGTGPNMIQYSPYNTSFLTYEGTSDSIWLVPLNLQTTDIRFVRVRQ